LRGISLAALALLFTAPRGLAQPATASVKGAVTSLAFDVISVKPSHSDSTEESMGMNRDGFTAANIQLHDLLLQAFELQEPEQLLGDPKWTTSDRWDVDARVAAEDIPALAKMTYHQRMGMFQQILIERFGMNAHHETRRLPVYALMVAKGGPKMAPSLLRPDDSAGIPGEPGLLIPSRGKETGRGTMMEFLARDLSEDLGRKVVDETGLTGRYDFTLTWTPDDSASAMEASTAAGATQAPSLFTAVQEQLGLKLEVVKAPVDVVVIDRLEKPAEN
jgi:uncharacterized protein (TIGR03435 family)